MTASITVNQFTEYLSKEAKDNKTMQNATVAIKSEFISCYPEPEKIDLSNEYAKVLRMTTLSVKMLAKASYKDSASLEHNEIESIKNTLSHYASKSDTINEFKQEIIADLTEFQEQIKSNHAQKSRDYIKEKQMCQKQAMVLNFEKNKIIMERLSKIIWPYNEKTKEYDGKIAKLNSQVRKYEQKIAELKGMRPFANEKDILLYQMHLNEKYSI